MSECVICGKNSGKGKTCSSTCRSKLSRSVAKGVTGATVEPDNATVSEPDATVALDLEKCQYCGTGLPPLEKPRKYVGACYQCVIKTRPRQDRTVGERWARPGRQGCTSLLSAPLKSEKNTPQEATA